MKHVAFITGARSEYSLARGLLRALKEDSDFELTIIANGMHLLQTYGHTITELRNDAYGRIYEVPTYSELSNEKVADFTNTVSALSIVLREILPDIAFIIGDRIEAYGAALAAHFVGIPIAHSGGGQITEGAIDNIYRYNITNLSDLHLVTSKLSQQRLRALPTVASDRVLFAGALNVDEIYSFRANPRGIDEFLDGVDSRPYALATFHPVTQGDEPIDSLLVRSVEVITSMGYNILLTYPNNDDGALPIIETILSIQNKPGVFVCESLGAEGYYAALNDCLFVIGNSSSGIREAPYFEKPIINVGNRQKGREKDVGIVDVPATAASICNAVTQGRSQGWPQPSCSNIYGNGTAVETCIEAIRIFLEH